MKLGLQIRKYRSDYNYSQEELSEMLFFSRQTISNWKNDKSYPDIQSLLLISSLFNVSLDQLVNYRYEKCGTEQSEEKKENLYSWIMILSFLLMAISIGPLLLSDNLFL